MKIVHTSDWHLGKMLYNQELTENHKAFFEQLSSIILDQQPDALLICGDIYETSNPAVSAQRLFHETILHFHTILPQMKIIIIAGNHDSAQRISVDSELWELANVHLISTIHTDEERMADYDKHIITIYDGKGDSLCLIGAIPFAYEQNFPKSEGNRILSFYQGVCHRMQELNSHKVPLVLMGHLTILGDVDFTGHKMDSIGGVETLNVSSILQEFNYLALGHIHHAQFIHDTQHKVRYCGTPIAVSFDEPYKHSVSIVTFDTQNNPIIEEEEIHTPHPLITLPEKPLPFLDAINALRSYSPQEESFIRLNVIAGSAPSDAMALAAAEMEGKTSQLLCINYARMEEDGPKDITHSITLTEFKEMTPIEIAKRYMGERFTEEMEKTFNEALQLLND